MSLIRSILIKLGLADLSAERQPISVFVLDDDARRHRWFEKKFVGDDLDIVETVEEAKQFLSENVYDAIFLDHDLLPHHYEGELDDEMTGYAVAHWLNENKKINRAATVIVHTRNADGALRMVEKIKESGRLVDYIPFPMLDMKVRHYWKR